jgi:hypothetical protein
MEKADREFRMDTAPKSDMSPEALRIHRSEELQVDVGGLRLTLGRSATTNLVRELSLALKEVGMASAFAEVAELEALRRKTLLSRAEAARLTPWSPAALDKMRKMGQGPRFVKVGGRIYYRPQDLVELAETHVVHTVDSYQG